MIKEIYINNFKTLSLLKLELGRINVLIGENGSGKTNILEAIALGSAAAEEKLDNEYLSNKGFRVTDIINYYSGFKKFKPNNTIDIAFICSDSTNSLLFKLQNDNKPYSAWRNIAKEELKTNIHTKITSNEYIDKMFNKFIDDPNVKEKIKPLLDEINKKLENASITPNKDVNLEKDIKIEFENLWKKLNSPQKVDELIKNLTSEFNAESYLLDFKIFAPENNFLRKFDDDSSNTLGFRGDGLFKLISIISKENPKELFKIKEKMRIFGWFEDFIIPKDLNINERRITIKDKFIKNGLKYIDQKSSNEGFLYLLFYFTLFVSQYTPKFFAIDNIDNSMNPKLGSHLIRILVELSKEYNKQVIMTTHNPAILDGIDLKDSEQRLFVVSRNKTGHTNINRIMKKKLIEGKSIKLSEQFLRGYIGGLPKNF